MPQLITLLFTLLSIPLTAQLYIDFGDEQTVNQGDYIIIPVKFEDFTDLLSFQFSINWDETAMDYEGIENLTTDVPSMNLGLVNTDLGFITVSWFNFGAGLTLEDSLLFNIKFKVKDSAAGEYKILLSGNPMLIEVINGSLESIGISSQEGIVQVLTTGTQQVKNSDFQHKIIPSLLTNRAEVRIDEQGLGDCFIQVYNPLGKLIEEKKLIEDQRGQFIYLNRSSFEQSGLYYYIIHTPFHSFSNSFIVI